MPPDTSAQRITELEISMTHLQRDYDALHEVLLSQQKTIDGLKRKLERLESEFVNRFSTQELGKDFVKI